MEEKVIRITEQALSEIESASSLEELEQLRVKYLGRKGVVRQLLKEIPSLPPEQRGKAGKVANRLKADVTQAVEKAREKFEKAAKIDLHVREVDISVPGRRAELGRRHPITQAINRICDIFARLGFEVATGPEVELPRYNFEALNMPLDHPSRDAFDTFYFDNDLILRSHTSPVQVRVMEKQKPPVRIIVPGKAFRPDTVDATHCFMFHQVEGLYVDEGVSLADLKAVLTMFASELFWPDVKVRFRPHFFPFTEPSVEFDISCAICQGKGCNVCSRKGWIELGGAGMVDPNVFKEVGYDAEKYTGFAFGLGIERLVMMKYGVDDIRLFFENDMRFLSQF